MIEANTYSPTSPTSSNHPHQGQFDASSMSVPFNPAWPPYPLTPESVGPDGYVSTGYDYFDLSMSSRALKESSLSQTYNPQLSHFNGQSGQPQGPASSASVLYHEGYGQSPYQHHRPHGPQHHNHQQSHQGQHQRQRQYAHPVSGR